MSISLAFEFLPIAYKCCPPAMLMGCIDLLLALEPLVVAAVASNPFKGFQSPLQLPPASVVPVNQTLSGSLYNVHPTGFPDSQEPLGLPPLPFC